MTLREHGQLLSYKSHHPDVHMQTLRTYTRPDNTHRAKKATANIYEANESYSPYSAPIVIVKKNTTQPQPYSNYRQPNKKQIILSDTLLRQPQGSFLQITYD